MAAKCTRSACQMLPSLFSLLIAITEIYGIRPQFVKFLQTVDYKFSTTKSSPGCWSRASTWDTRRSTRWPGCAPSGRKIKSISRVRIKSHSRRVQFYKETFLHRISNIHCNQKCFQDIICEGLGRAIQTKLCDGYSLLD